VVDQLMVATPSAPRASPAPSYCASAVRYWMVPYGRNRLFTGRKGIVEGIEGMAGDSRRIALYGLGGVGYV
jgi:hypothetical protein